MKEKYIMTFDLEDDYINPALICLNNIETMFRCLNTNYFDGTINSIKENPCKLDYFLSSYEDIHAMLRISFDYLREAKDILNDSLSGT